MQPCRSNPVRAGRHLATAAWSRVALAVGALAGQASAQEERPFTVEGSEDPSGVSLLGFFGDNLTWNLDLVARAGHGWTRDETTSLLAAGIDLHNVLSEPGGDLGTLVLQPYVVRRDNAFGVPNHVEDDDDWELELHQNWFNLTRFGKGTTNLRVGHFKYPYGLEPAVDTHFRLRQMITARNLGAKMDWGVSLNGTPAGLDYELGLLRGSGMEYVDKSDNHVVAGRVGTPYDQNVAAGVSAFYGETIDPGGLRRYRRGGGTAPTGDDILRRLRVGTDVTWIWRHLTTRAELSWGEDFDQEVWHALLDLEWVSREEGLRLYMQGRLFEQRAASGWDRDLGLRTGLEFTVTEQWSFATEFDADLDRYLGASRDDRLFVQVRLRL